MILYPDKNRSPIQSNILWFTNSRVFLNPSLFKILLFLTTTAFSKLPPLPRFNFFNFSMSSYKQKVLELKISSKLSSKILILFFWVLIILFLYFISNSISLVTFEVSREIDLSPSFKLIFLFILIILIVDH